MKSTLLVASCCIRVVSWIGQLGGGRSRNGQNLEKGGPPGATYGARIRLCRSTYPIALPTGTPQAYRVQMTDEEGSGALLRINSSVNPASGFCLVFLLPLLTCFAYFHTARHLNLQPNKQLFSDQLNHPQTIQHVRSRLLLRCLLHLRRLLRPQEISVFPASRCSVLNVYVGYIMSFLNLPRDFTDLRSVQTTT